MAEDQEWLNLEEMLRMTEREIYRDPEAHGVTREEWQRIRQWPEDDQPQGERSMKIKAIVIPADLDEPIRSEELSLRDVETYQRLIGGHFQVVDLSDPSANMYVHEEHKLLNLPVNARATVLLWLHNRSLRGRDVLGGPVLLVGPVDEVGDDTSVPQELVRRLLESGSYRVEVQTEDIDQWYGNELKFSDWFKAYSYAIDLGERWRLVTDLRVIRIVS